MLATKAFTFLLLSSSWLGTTRYFLLLAVLVFALTGTVPPTLAGCDEGVVSYQAGDLN